MTKPRPPTVYVLIGAQGAGKSTWARANVDRLEAVLLASDEIRNEIVESGQGSPTNGDLVFSRLEDRLRDLLAEGRNVVVDATHALRAWRQREIAVARAAGARVVAVWFDVPLAAALARNRMKPDTENWGERIVPDPVVRDIHRRLEPPGRDEFDETWRLTEKDLAVVSR